VDPFALALLKAERQMRRLFTHLVYQSSAFDRADVCSLRDVLVENRNIYFQISPLREKQNHSGPISRSTRFYTLDTVARELLPRYSSNQHYS